MEKYGFVYIWRDRKHNRYYIGCHWGTEDDGYICSSPWMKQAYKHRPNDFKRRILSLIYTNRQDMFNEEYKWISLIKESEIKTRYYNLNIKATGHWTANPNIFLTVRQKISKALTGHPSLCVSRQVSMETRQKISDTLKGRPINYTRSEQTRSIISENSKRLQYEKKVGMHGKTHSQETKDLMSKHNAMHDIINRKKISDANKGLQGLRLDGIKKMAKPNTEKWNDLINQGYIPINGDI